MSMIEIISNTIIMQVLQNTLNLLSSSGPIMGEAKTVPRSDKFPLSTPSIVQR